MLNQFLQGICLGVLTLLLTTGVAWSSPWSGNVLVAEHTPDHNATAPGETTPPKAEPAPHSTPADTSSAVPPDLEVRSRADQPMQADPSAPYDPYDYDALRQINRGIYGEKKAE
jgi:uncharacterized iron-regulated membrane protein